MRNTESVKLEYTVTQINEQIKDVLENLPVFTDITVIGEISNFTSHKTGHFYFTLKDEGAVLRAIMFKYAAQKISFSPQSGMKVRAKGRIGVFPRDGQYQLYVTDMIPEGEGSLAIAYEQLKNKLEIMGMFDPQKKKPLPKRPKTIGVITSDTGAAIRDIIDISKRRFPYAKLVLYPSLVQGEFAAKQLVKGVKFFNEKYPVDEIIIGRGGGSIEDLWAFNDEELAYAVFASKIPVISAVGHETDFTICDFVADIRAATPSAAAELATPDTQELKKKYNNIVSLLATKLQARINEMRARISTAAASRHLSSPKVQLDDKRMTVLRLHEILSTKIKYELQLKKNEFSQNASRLSALSPLDVIKRGYSVVYSKDGKLISETKDINVGENIDVKLSDGEFSATVQSIK